MKKNCTLLLLLFGALPLVAQQLVSSTYLKTYPVSYFVQEFGLFASYDVDTRAESYTRVRKSTMNRQR